VQYSHADLNVFEVLTGRRRSLGEKDAKKLESFLRNDVRLLTVRIKNPTEGFS